MSEMSRMLVRGLAKRPELVEALDELGIGPGEVFLIARPEVLGSPEDGHLGPFAKDSSTSRAAALDNYPRANTQRRRVLDFVIEAGERGATRDELEDGLGMLMQTVTPRVWELMKGGWLEETLSLRKTRQGSEASVLTATAKAFAEYQTQSSATPHLRIA